MLLPVSLEGHFSEHIVPTYTGSRESSISQVLAPGGRHTLYLVLVHGFIHPKYHYFKSDLLFTGHGGSCPTILTLKRMRQEYCCKLEARLGYKRNLRPGWVIKWYTVSNKTTKPEINRQTWVKVSYILMYSYAIKCMINGEQAAIFSNASFHLFEIDLTIVLYLQIIFCP